MHPEKIKERYIDVIRCPNSAASKDVRYRSIPNSRYFVSQTVWVKRARTKKESFKKQGSVFKTVNHPAIASYLFIRLDRPKAVLVGWETEMGLWRAATGGGFFCGFCLSKKKVAGDFFC